MQWPLLQCRFFQHGRASMKQSWKQSWRDSTKQHRRAAVNKRKGSKRCWWQAIVSVLVQSLLMQAAFADGEVKLPLGHEPEIDRPNPLSIVTNLPGDLTVWFRDTFNQENIPSLLGITGMTAIMTIGDYESFKAVNTPFLEHRDFKEFCNLGEYMGKGDFQIGITALFLAAGTFDKNRRALRTSAQIIEAIASSGIVVQVIKHTTGRESPFSSTKRTGMWHLFPNQREYQEDYQSHDAMPSGHLSTAMATFITIQENYPEQKWIPWVGYPIMGWIALGLVGKGIHWWSDFPIALALGYSFGRVVTRNNYRPVDTGPQRAWIPRISPTVNVDGDAQLMARWSW